MYKEFKTTLLLKWENNLLNHLHLISVNVLPTQKIQCLWSLFLVLVLIQWKILWGLQIHWEWVVNLEIFLLDKDKAQKQNKWSHLQHKEELGLFFKTVIFQFLGCQDWKKFAKHNLKKEQRLISDFGLPVNLILSSLFLFYRIV